MKLLNKVRLGNWFGLPSFKKAVINAVLPAFREKIKVFNYREDNN